MRGAVFDMLASLGADLSRVLDLYAGSGALGVEALSRGASWCDLVDRDRAACATIRENLALAGFQERARVLCLPVERVLESALGGEEPYSLVLVDPPYEDESAVAVVERLAASLLVASGSTLVLEHAWRLAAPGRLWPLQAGGAPSTRGYGRIYLSTGGVTWAWLSIPADSIPSPMAIWTSSNGPRPCSHGW